MPASRPGLSPLQATGADVSPASVTQVVRKYIPYITTGQESTFHTLRTLQHRASSIVMTTQNDPNMMWKEGSDFNSLIYMGHEITADNLRICQGAMEDETLSLLQAKLLFGHSFYIDIPNLKDDMGNVTPGYSLFNHRPNAMLFGYKDQVAHLILTSPDLRRRFVVSVQGDTINWNSNAMGEWLRHYTRLDLLCLAQVEMNCGAPGRTTELTAMACHNTRLGMPRNFRIIGGNFVLMRSYSKTRATQGSDRLIPHALNASLGAVLVYKEALCRPFAQLCAGTLFPGNDLIKSLYKDFLFVNHGRLFDGDDISAEMKRWSLQHIGVELGVRSWRQASTPFRRMKAGLQEEWLEAIETSDSAQAGHSHSIDHMRYGVTNHATLGLAEDFVQPFLATSIKWQRFLKLVPGQLARRPNKVTSAHLVVQEGFFCPFTCPPVPTLPPTALLRQRPSHRAAHPLRLPLPHLQRPLPFPCMGSMVPSQNR